MLTLAALGWFLWTWQRRTELKNRPGVAKGPFELIGNANDHEKDGSELHKADLRRKYELKGPDHLAESE